MQKYTYVFYHVDLDGAGVALLSLMYSLNKKVPVRSRCCSYGSINTAVTSILNNPDIGEIIIGDLSVNKSVAEQLDKVYKSDIPVRLRDHHSTALHLNQYEWALVKESDDKGVPRSGTWWLSQDTDFLSYYEEYKLLIHMIDDYDTWKWKSTGDDIPNRLNALFNILGTDGFINYIMSNPPAQVPSELFTDEANIMIDTYFRVIEAEVSHLEARMCTANMWVTSDGQEVKLRVGIVFLSGHISEVADLILNRHSEIDVLMLICYPFSISWRTIKNLPVSLGTVASLAVGKGGGHPKAAGVSIPRNVFSDMYTKFLESNFPNGIEFTNFEFPT